MFMQYCFMLQNNQLRLGLLLITFVFTLKVKMITHRKHCCVTDLAGDFAGQKFVTLFSFYEFK